MYLQASELAPWIDEFLEECAVFPNGPHDDQVDAMTQALLRLTRKEVEFFEPVSMTRVSPWNVQWNVM